jgi:hypothetical protein
MDKDRITDENKENKYKNQQGITYDYFIELTDNLTDENEKLRQEIQQLRSNKSFWMAALEKSDGTELFKSFREFLQDYLNFEGRSSRNRVMHSISQTLITSVFLGLILAAALYLTTKGFLDGSSTTFLIGTITGYYITYLTRREES